MLSNSSRCVVTSHCCCIYCRRTQQFFTAVIKNATCFGPSYLPSSGIQYVFHTQVYANEYSEFASSQILQYDVCVNVALNGKLNRSMCIALK
jgi:hypothetical protein